jgi:hypothetical protein
MTAPTQADFPALGFVPCPGDSEAMDAIQSAFSDTAGRLEEVCAVLTGADAGEWVGLTAIAFRDVLDGELRPKVEEAHQSFSDAARALSDWVVRMRDDQRTAETLEADAAAAQADLEAAQTALGGLPADTREEDPPEDETDEERRQREDDEDARDSAEQDVRVAEAALEEFRDRAYRLQEDYNEAGRDVADRLRDAIDIAPNEPGFFGSMAEAVSGWVDSFMDGLADLHDGIIAFLGAIAPVLAVINNVLGIVSVVLGIAAIAFPALAPFALGLGAVLLATTYLQKVGEDGGFLVALKNPAVIAALAGVALGGAGVALGRAAGPSMAAVRSMGGGSLRTMGFAMRPSGTYLSQGVSNTMRARNVLTGASHAQRIYGSGFNSEGNHFGRLTGIGVQGSWGGFSIGDAAGGGYSAADRQDHFTADRDEVGGGLLTTYDQAADYAE